VKSDRSGGLAHFFVLVIAWLASLFLTAAVSVGESIDPRIFSSPQEASKSLFAAVKSDDQALIMQILGGGEHHDVIRR